LKSYENFSDDLLAFKPIIGKRMKESGGRIYITSAL